MSDPSAAEGSPPRSPSSLASVDSSDADTPTLETQEPLDSVVVPATSTWTPDASKRLPPSLRSMSDPESSNPVSSSPLRVLANARNPRGPLPPMTSTLSGLNTDVMERMRVFHAQRLGKSSPKPVPGPGQVPPAALSPAGMRPVPAHPRSAPVVPGIGKPSLSERRMGGMKLSMPPVASPSGPGGRRPGAPGLSGLGGGAVDVMAGEPRALGSKMDEFKKYVDTEKGWITFEGAATITSTGVDFAGGQKFRISLDEIQVMGELGKGNYGVVYKVRHAKPAVPRFGQGLSGFRQSLLAQSAQSAQNAQQPHADPAVPVRRRDSNRDVPAVDAGSNTGVVMAMKEIRLELEDAKFTTILKELVILHECVSPYIIDFYGAFFQEGAVYMCIEYMDGGSIDKLYAGGIPEGVLRKITYSTVMGLKCLKDEHNIIHRDVKPTNILVNTRGQVKICDFGVSGNLVASIARTNIGCQSYMAPERITSGGMSQGDASDGTYSVQSDIWSLGLTIIECAVGRYPYPPEVSSTIFSQLSAIVDGEPPGLPEEGHSETAHDFVNKCLNKIPKARPTYAMLLSHPWLVSLAKPTTIEEEAEDESGDDDDVDGAAGVVAKLKLSSSTEDEEVAEWVQGILAGQRQEPGRSGGSSKPALHAAPLDTVSPASSPQVEHPV